MANAVNWKPVRKVVAMFLGSITTGTILAVGNTLGLHWITPELATALVPFFGLVAGYLTSAEAPSPPELRRIE